MQEGFWSRFFNKSDWFYYAGLIKIYTVSIAITANKIKTKKRADILTQ